MNNGHIHNRKLAKDPYQYNGLTLAYMGDAVYEQYVRHYLLRKGLVHPGKLHDEATRYVSARAQAAAIEGLLGQSFATEKETAVVYRGRNAKSKTMPKHVSPITYRWSTAFESVLGYLYLTNQHERLEQWMERAVTIIERSEGKR